MRLAEPESPGLSSLDGWPARTGEGGPSGPLMASDPGEKSRAPETDKFKCAVGKRRDNKVTVCTCGSQGILSATDAPRFDTRDTRLASPFSPDAPWHPPCVSRTAPPLHPHAAPFD